MAGRPADTPQSANFLTNRKNQMKHDKTFEAINKLKEVELELHRLKNALEMTNRALETKDEPVAWGMETDGLIYDVICPDEHEREEGEYTIPLYITPQRTWVELTDDEIEEVWGNTPIMLNARNNSIRINFAKSIEAKLKEKNHGN